MSNQVIKGNVGELYVLKTGEIRDQMGLNDFHPTSNTNVLIVNIEDGGGENTQAQINFAPQSRPNWSSVWFPLFFVGHFSKRISNESAVRTFAQYKIIVPSIVLAMNLNSAYAMPVKITFRQIGGLEFLGQFDSPAILQLEHPATQELSEELAVAYVYDGARSGFYQVEYNDELEIYEWVKTDNPTAHIQTKGYNMGEIKIQGGFGNNAPIQTISNAQYTLIWQELANHSQRINNIENQLESLMLDFEQQIEDVAQDLEDHIKDKSNPHETNADNAEYESGVSIKEKIDSDKQVLDDHVSDKENPHDVTAEQVDTYNKTTIDNKDANTLQAAKDYTYSKAEIDNKDTDKLDKIWTDLANQTTSLLTDEFVLNRGNSVYKTTLATMLSNVAATEIFVVVQELPEIGQINKIYLVISQDSEVQNIYEEFIWVFNEDTEEYEWERIGNASIDLSNYYTKPEITTLLLGKVDKVAGKGLSTNDYTNGDKQNVEKIPTIEQDIVDLESDKVDKNNAITPGTKTKITYDSKGLVTAGDDLVPSEIGAVEEALNDGKTYARKNKSWVEFQVGFLPDEETITLNNDDELEATNVAIWRYV